MEQVAQEQLKQLMNEIYDDITRKEKIENFDIDDIFSVNNRNDFNNTTLYGLNVRMKLDDPITPFLGGKKVGEKTIEELSKDIGENNIPNFFQEINNPKKSINTEESNNIEKAGATSSDHIEKTTKGIREIQFSIENDEVKISSINNINLLSEEELKKKKVLIEEELEKMKDLIEIEEELKKKKDLIEIEEELKKKKGPIEEELENMKDLIKEKLGTKNSFAIQQKENYFQEAKNSEVYFWISAEDQTEDQAEDQNKKIYYLSNILVISTKEEYIQLAKDHHLDFLRFLFRLKDGFVKDLEKKREAESMKSAIAAIMSRQTSHNLGSHVIPGARYNIRGMIQKITELPSKDLDGISRLLQYVQERMDFISMIVNIDEKDKLNSCLNLKTHVLDEIAMDGPAIRHHGDMQTKCTNYILRHIIKSEGFYRYEEIKNNLQNKKDWWNEATDDEFRKNTEDELKPVEIQIIKKTRGSYKKFTSISNGETDSSDFSKIDLSVPYGVNGRHAFLNILEDFIRNSAKHNKAALNDLESLVFSILVQEKSDLSEDLIKDDELLISIFSNKPSDDEEVREMKEAIKSLKLINEDGTINQAKKGLKEILICLSWLKDKMSNLRAIENQVNDDEFLSLNDENSLADYTLLSNPLNETENVKHLALRFVLPKYRFLYVIDEIKRIELVDNLDNTKLNFQEIFNLPSAELYILDDDNFSNGARLLKKSIPRLILKSELSSNNQIEVVGVEEAINGNEICNEIWEKNEFNKNKVEEINSTSYSLSDEYCTAIYKVYLTNKYEKYKNINLPKLFVLRGNQSDLKKNEDTSYLVRDEDTLEKVFKELNRNEEVIVFKNHNDGKEQFRYTLELFDEENKYPSFIEGISGNNFTFNLVISNTITELEYCKIVDSALTKIAIIDERVFEHYSDSEGVFSKANVTSNTNSTKTNYNIFKWKNIDLFNFYIPNDDEEEMYCIYDNHKDIIRDFDSYDYISIHYGLVEKYRPEIYKDLEYRFTKFKEEVLKITNESTVKIVLHSGRGYLTNLEHLVTFLPVSAIETQMTNCKHLLVQQFANLKYKF